MRTLATAEAKAGNIDRARAVAERMVSVFDAKELAPHVLHTIRHQAADTVAAITEMTGEGQQNEEATQGSSRRADDERDGADRSQRRL